MTFLQSLHAEEMRLKAAMGIERRRHKKYRNHDGAVCPCYGCRAYRRLHPEVYGDQTPLRKRKPKAKNGEGQRKRDIGRIVELNRRQREKFAKRVVYREP